MTLHVPVGTTAHIPTGTSVQRDFATYTSQYAAKDATLTATRHLNFILKEIPADRASDYNAFLRTVQNDESQVFTLERPTNPCSTGQTLGHRVSCKAGKASAEVRSPRRLPASSSSPSPLTSCDLVKSAWPSRAVSAPRSCPS